MEYVSDVEESDEEDIEDLESLLNSESADEDGASNEDDEEDDEDDDTGSSADNSDEVDFTPKKPAIGMKRKGGKLPPSKRSKKGAKVEIEYEIASEQPLREAILAR